MKKIPLNKGKFATIDDKDFEELGQMRWELDGNGYVYSRSQRNRSVKRIWLHKLLLDCPRSMEIDHIDGNILNNQRANLRVVTHADNLKNQKLRKNNTTGLNGVGWFGAGKKWRARIMVDYKEIHLGYFEDKQEAIKARRKAEQTYFGEFTRGVL